MKRLWFLIPLAAFLALAVSSRSASSAIRTRCPRRSSTSRRRSSRSPASTTPSKVVKLDDLRGKAFILNVWASWCVACREEHPVLVEFAKKRAVPLYGLNYKDTRADANALAASFGNPYDASFFDEDGRVGIDFGVYGVPETFVVDGNGVIRMKHIGPITPEVLATRSSRLLKKLDA